MDCYVQRTDPHNSVDTLDRLLRQLGGSDDWKRCMTDVLNQNGFRDARLLRFEYNLATARYWNDMYMSTWEEFATKVTGESPESVVALSSEAMGEVRSGAAIICPKLVWVAKKA